MLYVNVASKNRETRTKATSRKFKLLSEAENETLLKKLATAKTDKEAATIIRREVAALVGDRQIHHAISATVHGALEQHPILKGKYRLRDSRFETLATNYEAHHGWEEWHRKLDEEVAKWINEHGNATEVVFEEWLRSRYALEDLKVRFPKDL